jgi:hypothetical protein
VNRFESTSKPSHVKPIDAQTGDRPRCFNGGAYTLPTIECAGQSAFPPEPRGQVGQRTGERDERRKKETLARFLVPGFQD